MKNILLLVMVMLLAFTQTNAQKIYLTNGTSINAKDIFLTKRAVHYHYSPDKTGNTYVILKKNVRAIEYGDGHLETMSQEPIRDTFRVGSHLNSWGIDIGGSLSLGYQQEKDYNYTSNLMFSVQRQWGYQMSKGTSIWIGGEFRTYNSYGTSDTLTAKKRFTYTVDYIGLPLSFHIMKIVPKATWYATFTVSPGIRYYGDNNTIIHSDEKPTSIGFAGHTVFSVGGSFKANRTIIQAGPYVDYLIYGSGGSMLGYGVKLTIIE